MDIKLLIWLVVLIASLILIIALWHIDKLFALFGAKSVEPQSSVLEKNEQHFQANTHPTFSILSRLIDTLDYAQVQSQTVETLSHLVATNFVSVAIRDHSENGQLSVTHWQPNSEQDKPRHFQTGLLTWPFWETLLACDAYTDFSTQSGEHAADVRGFMADMKVKNGRSLAAIPLINNGLSMGVLLFTPSERTTETRTTVQEFAQVAAKAIYNAQKHSIALSHWFTALDSTIIAEPLDANILLEETLNPEETLVLEDLFKSSNETERMNGLDAVRELALKNKPNGEGESAESSPIDHQPLA